MSLPYSLLISCLLPSLISLFLTSHYHFRGHPFRSSRNTIVFPPLAFWNTTLTRISSKFRGYSSRDHFSAFSSSACPVSTWALQGSVLALFLVISFSRIVEMPSYVLISSGIPCAWILTCSIMTSFFFFLMDQIKGQFSSHLWALSVDFRWKSQGESFHSWSLASGRSFWDMVPPCDAPPLFPCASQTGFGVPFLLEMHESKSLFIELSVFISWEAKAL